MALDGQRMFPRQSLHVFIFKCNAEIILGILSAAQAQTISLTWSCPPVFGVKLACPPHTGSLHWITLRAAIR